MTDKTNELKDAVEKLVEKLFTSGSGNKADRLVLWTDADVFTKNLGGWGKKVIADKLTELYQAGYDHAAAELPWIPIRSADDLPKENGYYLATCGSVGIDPDDTTSHELNWFSGKWYLPSDEMIEMDGVIAWMKKPQPYTEPADHIAEVGEMEGV